MDTYQLINQKFSLSSYTCQQLNKTAHALLEEGVRKGDTVSVYLYNCHEFVNVYLACAEINRVKDRSNFRTG
ncbi:AMP-binding protein [Bacillus sp. SS-TM]